ERVGVAIRRIGVIEDVGDSLLPPEERRETGDVDTSQLGYARDLVTLGLVDRVLRVVVQRIPRLPGVVPVPTGVYHGHRVMPYLSQRRLHGRIEDRARRAVRTVVAVPGRSEDVIRRDVFPRRRRKALPELGGEREHVADRPVERDLEELHVVRLVVGNLRT